MYPETRLGRMMVIVACFVAVILLAITVNLCISRLSLSPVERQFKNKMDVWASRKNVQVVLLRGIFGNCSDCAVLRTQQRGLFRQRGVHM